MGSILDAYSRQVEEDNNQKEIDKIIDPQYGDITADVASEVQNLRNKINADNLEMSNRKNEFIKKADKNINRESENKDSIFNIDKLIKNQDIDLVKDLKDEPNKRIISENESNSPFKVVQDDNFIISESKPDGTYEDDFDKLKNEELNITDEKVSIFVQHAYCPNCGKEIISKGPAMYNPMTMEPASFYVCPQCRKKMQLESSFPRLIVKDKENKIIKSYID